MIMRHILKLGSPPGLKEDVIGIPYLLALLIDHGDDRNTESGRLSDSSTIGLSVRLGVPFVSSAIAFIF